MPEKLISAIRESALVSMLSFRLIFFVIRLARRALCGRRAGAFFKARRYQRGQSSEEQRLMNDTRCVRVVKRFECAH